MKRNFEYPKRSYRIFLLDISKQLASGLWCHAFNLSLAVILEKLVTRGNGCEWYFVNFCCEVGIGLFLTFIIHESILYFANKYDILIL